MNQELPQNFEHEKPAESLGGKIDAMKEAIHSHLKELDEQEAYYEKRRKPLPDKIYHVTTRQNAQQILREGLDPSKLMYEDSEVISLSDNIDFAIGVARVTQNTTERNLVVLEIDTRHLTPARVHNYLRKADPGNPNPIDAAEIHEVHYESTISPDAIKIVKYKKKK